MWIVGDLTLWKSRFFAPQRTLKFSLIISTFKSVLPEFKRFHILQLKGILCHLSTNPPSQLDQILFEQIGIFFSLFSYSFKKLFLISLNACSYSKRINHGSKSLVCFSTVRPRDTRPQAARNSQVHVFELGPKIFEVHVFARFCTFFDKWVLEMHVFTRFCTFFSTWVLEIHDTPIK